jgi:hypothetical protein
MCDNSDDIRSLPADVFKIGPDGSKAFVDCKAVPEISLNVWFGKSRGFLWVSDPLCLSSSSALHFFQLFFLGPPPC